MPSENEKLVQEENGFKVNGRESSRLLIQTSDVTPPLWIRRIPGDAFPKFGYFGFEVVRQCDQESGHHLCIVPCLARITRRPFDGSPHGVQPRADRSRPTLSPSWRGRGTWLRSGSPGVASRLPLDHSRIARCTLRSHRLGLCTFRDHTSGTPRLSIPAPLPASPVRPSQDG